MEIGFVINPNITINFAINEQSMPVYGTKLDMTNEVHIDSEMNYLRYKRIDEFIDEEFNETNLDRTLIDLMEEEG